MITVEGQSINEWRNLLFDSELPQSVKLVGLAIARYWRPDKLCYPSITTLMADCSIRSKHTVINAIKELAAAKFIKIKKGQIKYLSSLQNFYELVGVGNGATNGASNGATNGAINAPEIREIREDENIYINNNTLKIPSKPQKKQKDYSERFQTWWQECPKKVSKVAAQKAFNRALEENKATFDELIDGIKRYATYCRQQKTEDKFIKHPATWLNQGCWADEYAQKESVWEHNLRIMREVDDEINQKGVR